MHCTAKLISGRPCTRKAATGAEFCTLHASSYLRRAARAFYKTRLSDDEREALAAAAQLAGVDSEIAVLRVLIRRVLTQGDVEAARKGIDTLVRTLKARHDLDEQSSGQLAQSLERVLDTLAAEEVG